MSYFSSQSKFLKIIKYESIIIIYPCFQYRGTAKIQVLILLNSTTFLKTDIHEMLLNSEAMSPSFLLFSVQKRISKTEVIESTFSTYCYWQQQTIDRAVGKPQQPGETWPHNPGKTEQDTLHAIVYFVLDFERQERVNRKTNILSLCLRDANGGSTKYSIPPFSFACGGSRFKGR